MKSTPSPYEAPLVAFDFSPLRDAVWKDAGALQSRDLGLGKASGGEIGARNLRSPDGAPIEQWPDTDDSVFRMLFLLSGTLTFDVEDGRTATLSKFDAIHLPLLERARNFRFADDFEAMDIRVPNFESALGPGDFSSIFQFDAPVGNDLGINRETPGNYQTGKGPRSFMRYRDLGSQGQTNGRIHIHLVKVDGAAPAGGTGWHYHSMGQLFYVLTGNGEISAVTRDIIPIGAGDAMCIGAGMLHNVSSFSSDYSVIELCLPADYDTIPASPPPA
ncbi:cupin domain-containing protein [Chelativorans sp. ZYF759]|uniref:cupin domain-containing protein n=1 Tax=Chelativorans sp. ZYF759 TaxID=2692213 RepID=UPI00145E9649|nr:cupin domain-containing protein [Chelativorans sp. ZYF759]NMG41706.1 cupin domain-containing protein [Chelativorans sp. ZYF759]